MAEGTLEAERARLEELYRRYGGLIASWSAKLGGPGVDTEDLVQEVFLVIAETLKDFRGDAKLTTWLFRITENVVRNRRRQERLRRWLAVFGEETARRLMAAAPDPGDSLERTEAQTRIYRALDGLSEVHRTALILFEIEGLKCEEIAELTEVRPEAVWMRLTRARRHFIRRFTALERQP
jgi:RNA polymerase sigma-70 factor (ECF subfamily)